MLLARLKRLIRRREIEGVAVERDAQKRRGRAVVYGLERVRLRRAIGEEVGGIGRGGDQVTIGRIAVEIGAQLGVEGGADNAFVAEERQAVAGPVVCIDFRYAELTQAGDRRRGVSGRGREEIASR